MNFIERAEMLEELADLAAEIGDHDLEEICLKEMAKMKEYVVSQLPKTAP